jgi:hypothetical protein
MALMTENQRFVGQHRSLNPTGFTLGFFQLDNEWLSKN